MYWHALCRLLALKVCSLCIRLHAAALCVPAYAHPSVHVQTLVQGPVMGYGMVGMPCRLVTARLLARLAMPLVQGALSWEVCMHHAATRAYFTTMHAWSCLDTQTLSRDKVGAHINSLCRAPAAKRSPSAWDWHARREHPHGC